MTDRWSSVILFALLAVVAACDGAPGLTDPSDRGGPCASEETFCADKTLNPLPPEDVRRWEEAANVYADEQYGAYTHVYPNVQWHACFFGVGGTCAAGYTSSKSLIHVSTAQPQRTAALVAHETLHARYWRQFGDPDAGHKRRYAW